MADESTNENGTEESGSATENGQQGAEGGLGEAGKKALDEERKARKAAERTASSSQKQIDDLTKRLKEFEDRDKSEADKLTERMTSAEQRASAAETRLMRYEVAADKKLPSEWAARLQGSTKEELEADADSLLEALGAQQQRQTPNYDGGVRQTAKPTDMNSLIRQQAGMG